MNWDEFNQLNTVEKIIYTKNNGVKIRTQWDEIERGSRTAVAILNWPDCYYHFEGPESDGDGVVVWINAEFSPSNALTGIVEADPPIIDVLEDNRD